MEVEKLCLFCKHWYFDGGSPGYSEWTPGTDARITCEKKHWTTGSGERKTQIDITNIYSEHEFRQLMQKATTCPDYEQVELPINVRQTNS